MIDKDRGSVASTECSLILIRIKNAAAAPALTGRR